MPCFIELMLYDVSSCYMMWAHATLFEPNFWIISIDSLRKYLKMWSNLGQNWPKVVHFSLNFSQPHFSREMSRKLFLVLARNARNVHVEYWPMPVHFKLFLSPGYVISANTTWFEPKWPSTRPRRGLARPDRSLNQSLDRVEFVPSFSGQYLTWAKI